MQSLSHAAICLQRPIYTHGQLYVVLSSVTSKHGVKILAIDYEGKTCSTTTNVAVRLWCVVGDFNFVRAMEERCGISSGSDHFHRDTVEFNAFINSMELLDIPLTGCRFTWFRPNGQAVSRLEWQDMWPNCYQQVLGRDISDHCPMLIKSSNLNWGPRPFRVLNCWFHDPGFFKFVENEWSRLHFNGWGAFILKENLRALRLRLKTWNAEVFGDLTKRRREIEQKMMEMDLKAEDGVLSEEEAKENRDLQLNFWKVTMQNESLLYQKSTSCLIREGDSNTRFFHYTINWKRRKNTLLGLNVDNNWIEEPSEVKQKAKEFFERKFEKDNAEAPRLDGVSFNQLSQGDNDFLIAPFGLEEIKEAV